MTVIIKKQGTVKHDSATVRVISLNVIGQNVNQWYMLKMNVRPIYVNQEYASGEGLEFLRGTEQPSRCSKII